MSPQKIFLSWSNLKINHPICELWTIFLCKHTAKYVSQYPYCLVSTWNMVFDPLNYGHIYQSNSVQMVFLPASPPFINVKVFPSYLMSETVWWMSGVPHVQKRPRWKNNNGGGGAWNDFPGQESLQPTKPSQDSLSLCCLSGSKGKWSGSWRRPDCMILTERDERCLWQGTSLLHGWTIFWNSLLWCP